MTRARGEAEPDAEAGRGARVAGVLGPVTGALLVGALLVLLTWAAAAGGGPLVRGDGPAPTERTPSVVRPTATASAEAGDRLEALEDRDRPSRSGPPWLGWIVLVVAAAGFLLALARLVRRAWRAWRDRAPVAGLDPDAVDLGPLSPAAMAREVADDADEQRRLLADGPPRNAIVRCWHHFEGLAERCGLARQPWETPAELTLRFFDVLDADPGAVQRLATLYREARFSDHDVTEADRRAAEAAWAAVHAGLAGRAGSLR